MTDLEKLKEILASGEEPHIWVSNVPGTDRCIVRVFPKQPKSGADADDGAWIHLSLDKIVKL